MKETLVNKLAELLDIKDVEYKHIDHGLVAVFLCRKSIQDGLSVHFCVSFSDITISVMFQAPVESIELTLQEDMTEDHIRNTIESIGEVIDAIRDKTHE